MYSCSARENYVNSVNAARQAHVNHIAEKVGASSGTYRKYGVPGVHGYAGAPYHHGAYAYPGAYPGVFAGAYPGGYLG